MLFTNVTGIFSPDIPAILLQNPGSFSPVPYKTTTEKESDSGARMWKVIDLNSTTPA
jgi:hypothetical protein